MARPTGVVLQPSGALDEDGCAALRRAISAALATGARHVVLDFSGVTHLEVQAVQLLRGVQQFLYRQDGGLVVIKPSVPALNGLRVNDLTDLLSVDDVPMTDSAQVAG